MHVPSMETRELTLLPFEEALASANTPNPDYDIQKCLYAPSFY